MKDITLREVTEKNFDQIVKLSNTLSESQKKCVAPNITSLAQAYVNKERAWPRAIYLGDEPVGFIMLALWDDDIPKEDWPAYFLWRFMMAADHQGKGYGKAVLDLMIEKCKKDGIKTFYTSCDMEGKEPYGFYTRYGFVDTGINDDEQVLRMVIEDM